jgi:hypothetical protein
MRQFFRSALAAAAMVSVASCTVGRVSAVSPAGPAASQFPSPALLPGGSPGKAPIVLPRAATVDDLSATAVSRAAVIIEWTMNTVTDTSQYQAELRSAPFLAPAYLAALRDTAPAAAPGAEWDEWASHDAYTTVAVVAEHDDPPPDTAVLARRQWGITVTPRGLPACPARPKAARGRGRRPRRRGGHEARRARRSSPRVKHPAGPHCGWTGSPVTATVFVTLMRPRSGSAWRVSAVTVSF